MGKGGEVAEIGRPLRRDLDYFDVDVSSDVLQELIGCSHETIRRRVNDNALVKVGRGRFKLIESLRTYFTYLEKVAGGRGGEEEQADLAVANARLKRAQAEREEMRLAKEKGELLDAAEVERAWSQDWKNVSNTMLAVASRVASDLPHLSRQDTNVIDRAIRDALTAAGAGENRGEKKAR